MTSEIRIGVGGALGRMGRAVSAIVRDRVGVVYSGRFGRPEATEDDGGVPPLSSLENVLSCSDVVIDFSNGPATAALATVAAAAGGPALVIGATGLTDEEEASVLAAAGRIAIVKSGNYSIGVNVLAGLVEHASRRLPADYWDIEIVETHHRRKVDAPSGTALLLAEAAARGRGRLLADVRIGPREGITGPRPSGGIGIGSLRGGGVVGDHSVTFAADEEVVTLSHSARDRTLFARGAVEAAAWVQDRPPGLYDMIDVLGFRNQLY